MSPAIARAVQPLRQLQTRPSVVVSLPVRGLPSCSSARFTRFAVPVTNTRSKSTMAEQSIVFTKNAPSPVGPYSQAIKTPTAIYCSGQIPLTPTGEMVEGSIGDKTKQCCQNLEAVLKEAGSSIPKVVKCNIFLSDMAHFAPMNEEYEKWFSHKPARSCVAVKTLPKNVDVEIEAIALP